MLESGKREREKGNDDANDEKSVAVIEIIGIAFCLLRALVVSAPEFDDDDDDFDGNRDDDSDDDGRVFVAAIERVKRRRKLEKEERGKFVYVLLLVVVVVSKNPRGDVLGNFRELPERFSAVESESDKGARKHRGGILLRGRGRGGGGNHLREENVVVVCVVRVLRSALAGFVSRMRVDARVERDTSERVGCAGGGGREVRSGGR